MEEGGAVSAPEKRELPRSNLFLAAVLQTRTEQERVKLRNMSSRGAMIESPLLPPAGTIVHLIRGSLSVEAIVIWRSDKQCGVHFNGEVSVKAWMAPPGNGEQQRIDALVSQAKSGGWSNPVPEPWQRGQRREGLPKAQIVEDLGSVYRLIEDLADNLAEDTDAFMRHAVKLQNLDVAMQMLAALAKEIADDREDSKNVSMAKLRDLRVACMQALRSG